jgi:hypothetical protein
MFGLVEAGGSFRLGFWGIVLTGWMATPAVLFARELVAFSCAIPGAEKANQADNMMVMRYLFFIISFIHATSSLLDRCNYQGSTFFKPPGDWWEYSRIPDDRPFHCHFLRTQPTMINNSNVNTH